MPLILLIEADRRHTSRISILARNQLHADLLIVDNVEQALEKLDECDPDLILTSPLMSGRDQLALGNRLLELEEEDGLRIQTLTIPALGVAGQRARVPQKGGPGRAPVQRGRPSQTDGIDPVVFGMQIAMMLDRIAAERAASGTIVRRRETTAIGLDEEEPEEIEEAPAVEAPRPVDAPRSIDAPRSSAQPDWGELLDAMRREIEVAQSSTQPQLDRLASPHLNLDVDLSALPTAIENLPPAIKPATPEPLAAPVAASAPPARKTKKVRRVPAQDEFGFFDPQQCGLSALFAKLDTIAPPGKAVTPKKTS